MPAGVDARARRARVRRAGAGTARPGGGLRDRLRGDRRRRGRQRRPQRRAGLARAELVLHAVAFGPAAQSQLRDRGTARFVAQTAGFRVGAERFAVASVDDLARSRWRSRLDGSLAGGGAPGARAAPAGEPAGPRRAPGRPGLPGGGERVTPATATSRGCARAPRTRSTNADTLAPCSRGPAATPLSTLPVGLLVNDTTPVDVPVRRLRARATSSASTRAPSSAPTRSRARPTSSRTTSRASSSTRPTSRGSSPPRRRARTGGCGRGSCSSSCGRRDGRVAALEPRPPLPQLDAPVGELPDLAESWAWAHAQVVADATRPAGRALLTSQPDRNLSRLLCPRRLEPETALPRLRRARLRGRAQGRGSARR